MKKPGVLAVVLTAAISLTIAKEKVDKRLPAAKDGLVTIENVAGSVRVNGWERDEVEITGMLGKETKELVFTNTGSRTTIRVDVLSHTRNLEGSDLVIQVPRSSRVEIIVISSTAAVAGLQGELSIDSVSGNVEAMGAVREAEVSTLSGTIQFRTDGTLAKGLFKSVSGKIDVAALLDTAGRLEFETVSGPVDLRLPKRTSADFDVSSFSGDITNDFGEKATKSDQFLPSLDLKFSIGGGGARVSVQTFSGSIHLWAE